MVSKSLLNFSKLGPSHISKGQSLDFLGFHFFVRNEAFSMGYRDPLGIKSFSWLSLPIKAIASGVIGFHRRPKSSANHPLCTVSRHCS